MFKILYIALIVFLSGCQFGLTPENTGETVDSNFVMAAAYMVGIENSQITASAEAPFWELDTEDVTFELVDGFTEEFVGYPERNQVTNVTVEAFEDNFRITSITTYPDNDFITETKEIYILQPDRNHVNYLNREEYITYFSDGSRRIYEITGFDTYDETRESHVFGSVVEYTQRASDGIFENMHINGRVEYRELPGNKSITTITEEGFVINLLYNGRIYRGRTNFTSEIIIEIEDRVRTRESFRYDFSDIGLIIEN